MTGTGLEKLTVAKDLPPRALLAVPEWGPTVEGCRCRIQVVKSRFAPDERIQFVFQMESDGQSADVLRIERREDISITIDDMPARVGSTQLPAEHVIDFPKEAEIKLDRNPDLAAGKHKLSREEAAGRQRLPAAADRTQN